MQIICKNCNSVILSDNIDLNTKTAKCNKCNINFDCKSELNEIIYTKPKIENMPKDIKINKDIYGLNITTSWYNSETRSKTLVTVILDIISIIIIYFSDTTYKIIFGIILIVSTYSMICGYVNKTSITVNSQTLKLKHFPLPAFGNKILNIKDIKQFYNIKRISSEINGKINYCYDLRVATNSNKNIKLISCIVEPELALYIEQELEKYLKIKDEHIDGEVEW